MFGKREPRAPVLWIVRNELPAELREALRRAQRRVRQRQAVEREISALRGFVDNLFPDAGGLRHAVVACVDVAEIQVRGHHAGVEIDGRLESRDRAGVVAAGDGLQPELVFEEGEYGLAAAILGASLAAQGAADIVGLLPLMLIFVKLLDIEQRVLVVGIDPDDLVERFERAIDESATLEIEPETEQDVRLFEARQARPLQQTLMDVDGPRDLTLFTVKAAEEQVNLERVAEAFGRLAQLLDREIDLIRNEEIQADDVVQRLRHAAPIDQPARAQLVAFPRFPDRQSDEKRDQRGEERVVGAQNNSVRHRSCR